MGIAPPCGRAILAQVEKRATGRLQRFPVSCGYLMALFPAWANLNGIADVPAARRHFGVEDAVWTAWIAQVGDPGNDLRLLAALPRTALQGGCQTATLPGGQGFSAIQATQVGLLWRLARRVVAFRAGISADEFQDDDPWESPRDGATTGGPAPGVPATVKDKVLKMSALIDQADESELIPPTADEVDGWLQNYVNVMGAPPEEEEEPTAAQLAALRKKIQTGGAPYTDFGVWQPYERRATKTQKFRTFVPLGDGSFLQKELPGPSNFQQWLYSWRVFKAAALMLGVISLAALQAYEKHIEKLTSQWPLVWGLIAKADDTARAEKLDKIKRKILVDVGNGGQAPLDWDATAPWSCCFKMLVQDEKWWTEQVRNPAVAWTASGGRGAPMAPADNVTRAHFPGVHDSPTEVPEVNDRKRQANRDKRLAKKVRFQREREELNRLRSGNGGRSSETELQGGGKPKGKGKNKDQSGEEICFSFASGKGPCGKLSPGSACLGKVKRVHKCQICLSPNHRNGECPDAS